MRALSLYLLALTLCCFLKKGYCGKKYTYEEFKSNHKIMPWAEKFFEKRVPGRKVYEKLIENGIDVSEGAVLRWLRKLQKEREGSLNHINNTIEKSLTEDMQRLYERQYAIMMQSVPGASSHYGGAIPSQQVPPTDDTFVPPQAGTDSTNWFGGISQNNDEDLQSMVNPPSSWKRALGSVPSWFGASQQEPQFSPSMHDTSAASSYYPSNQPDDQTLDSMITPRNQKGSAAYYGGAMPSSHYGGAMPFQQAPMPGTSFSAFPNYPSNQSAPLNPSTNIVPSQPGTPSLDWSGGNSRQ